MTQTATRCVAVTGVSTGIGYAVSRELLRRGYRVFGSVRSAEAAEGIQSALGARFTPLVFNVTDREAVFDAAEHVRAEVGETGLAGLVNNAGITFAGPLLHQPFEEVKATVDVNLLGVVSVTQAFLPLLGPGRRPDRVVNVSSTEGVVSSPFLAAYSASKHALEGLSDSLRRELLPYGVDVLTITTGPVKSENWRKVLERRSAYDGTDYAGSFAAYLTVASRARA